MKSYTTDSFWRAYRRLNDETQRQAREAYRLFQADPAHPSLRFKKAHTSTTVYSVRISRDCRALAVPDGDDLVWFWIGPHGEYDRLISRL